MSGPGTKATAPIGTKAKRELKSNVMLNTVS